MVCRNTPLQLRLRLTLSSILLGWDGDGTSHPTSTQGRELRMIDDTLKAAGENAANPNLIFFVAVERKSIFF